MKRLTVLSLALGVLTIGLTACGGGSSSTDANGPHRTVTPATSSAVATPAGPTASAAPAPSAAATSTAGSADTPASQITCDQFRQMNADSEKSLMQRLIKENPGSKFDGSPNVALGTAKLVCLSKSEANKTVAAAVGITAG